MIRRFTILTLALLYTFFLSRGPHAESAGGQATGERLDEASAGDTIGLRASLTPFKGQGRDASVAVVVDVDATTLDLRETQGAYVGGLRVGYIGTDSRGRTLTGSLYDGAVVLSRADYQRASREALRLVSRIIEVPEGRYQWRISAGTMTRAGSVVQELEVPGFRGRLTMSGIDISSVAAARGVPLRSPQPLRPAADAPTARRDFDGSDTLTLFTEVYEGHRRLHEGPTQGAPADPDFQERGDHTVHAFAELRARDGSILLTSPGRRVSNGEQAAGMHAFVTQVPLSGVPSGQYTIRLKARANIGEADTVTREVPIRVR
jgi:hypothetical protein